MINMAARSFRTWYVLITCFHESRIFYFEWFFEKCFVFLLKNIRYVGIFSPLIFKIKSKKTSKRHQFSMTFPCVFRYLTKKTSTIDDFSLCFQVSDKKHKEESLKVDVFSVSFGLNFEDEGAILYLKVKYKVPKLNIKTRTLFLDDFSLLIECVAKKCADWQNLTVASKPQDSIVFDEFLTKGFLEQVLLTLDVGQSLNFLSGLTRISLQLESELSVDFVIFIKTRRF